MLKLHRKTKKSESRYALQIAEAGLEAILPKNVIQEQIQINRDFIMIEGKKFPLKKEKLYIIGGGKASLKMAQTLIKSIPKEIELVGTINNPVQGNIPPLEVLKASHPLPDAKGVRGTKRMLELTKGLTPNDTVICLISSGGSALLPSPVAGVSLNDMQAVTDLMIKGGVEVFEMQRVRKHISRIKGGQLAKHLYPAQVITLILSDLVNPNDVVASGPTEPDPSTYQDALEVLSKYKLADKAPSSVVSHLKKGALGDLPETPKKGDPVFERVHNIVLADYSSALQAMAQKARDLGYTSVIRKQPLLGDITSQTKLIAKEITSLAQKITQPTAYLYNSELTVAVTGSGQGGRCQEHSARLARLLSDISSYTALSIGSDGIDHTEKAAGAIITENTYPTWQKQGVDSAEYVNNNDSYHLHLKSGTIITGRKTGTSVGDLHLCLLPGKP